MPRFTKTKSILYVEDEKKVQEELAEVLTAFCENLYVADNGAEGLELFEKHLPEIVITDISMPIMNGLEMSKRILELESKTKIIFITAFSDSDYMGEAISLHADGYITKPIDLMHLEKVLLKSIQVLQLEQKLELEIQNNLNKKAELETILATTKDGIAILDLESKYLYANKAYQNMMGYTFEELKKTNCIALGINEDKESSFEALKVLMTKGIIDQFEKKCVRADGKIITVSISASLMPERDRILMATRDITHEVHTKKILNDYVALVDENIITSTTDLDARITYVSKAFCTITGYTKEELLGKSHNIIRHKEMPNEIYTQMWEKLQNNETWQGELKNKKKNGDFYWVDAKVYPIYDEFEKKIGYTAIRQDITDYKRVQELSITDALTGVYNRRYFNEKFSKYINSAKRNKECISFAIFDIDFFKLYNDTYGHQKGDDVLVAVTKAVKGLLLRSDDYLFRLGGEEFGLLFKTDTKEQSVKFTKKILQAIEGLKIAHKKSTVSEYVTTSLGLICIKADLVSDLSLLYKEVDDLLYEAKTNGRNRVCYNKDKEMSDE